MSLGAKLAACLTGKIEKQKIKKMPQRPDRPARSSSDREAELVFDDLSKSRSCSSISSVSVARTLGFVSFSTRLSAGYTHIRSFPEASAARRKGTSPLAHSHVHVLPDGDGGKMADLQSSGVSH